MEANEEMIKWLLNDSGESISAISKATGLAWSTVSDLKKEVTPIGNTSFENASKLTKYAKKIKGVKEMENKNYVLRTMEEGELQDIKGFDTVEEVHAYLVDNTDKLFGWIQESEPERELPEFRDAGTLREINSILSDYDYSWWTIELEEN